MPLDYLIDGELRGRHGLVAWDCEWVGGGMASGLGFRGDVCCEVGGSLLGGDSEGGGGLGCFPGGCKFREESAGM